MPTRTAIGNMYFGRKHGPMCQDYTDQCSIFFNEVESVDVGHATHIVDNHEQDAIDGFWCEHGCYCFHLKLTPAW